MQMPSTQFVESCLVLIREKHLDEVSVRNLRAVQTLRRLPAQQRRQKDEMCARILAVRTVQILPAAQIISRGIEQEKVSSLS